MASVVESVQNDWETREVLEMVQLKVLDIVEFVNKFDQQVRYKLSGFHEKLVKLERTLELAESSVAVSSYIIKTKREERKRQLEQGEEYSYQDDGIHDKDFNMEPKG